MCTRLLDPPPEDVVSTLDQIDTAIRRGHPSVLARYDILAIVDMWPELTARVAAGGGAKDSSGIASPTKVAPLPVRVDVVDVVSEVDQWATFLARALMEETDWEPQGTSTPALLRQIAQRVGHFTEHEDEMLALAFCDDAERLRALVLKTARPSGRRSIRIGAKCWEHGTSDLGERVACRGNLTVLADPERANVVPDVVCDQDSAHRIDPTTWQRAWRRTGDAVGAVRLVARWHAELVDMSASA